MEKTLGSIANKPKPKLDRSKVLVGPGVDELRNLVGQAVREKFKPAKGKDKGGPTVCEDGVWVKDLIGDHAIVEQKGESEAVPFQYKDGKVTLGEPFPVRQEYVAV